MKKDRKAYALKDSGNQLQKDSKKLIQFIESDNITTSDRMKESELATQDRKAAETKIKKFETNIQTVKSEIDKNSDQLTALEEHKTFLYDIFEKENPKWVEEQMKNKKNKLKQVKKDWIERKKMYKDS